MLAPVSAASASANGQSATTARPFLARLRSSFGYASSSTMVGEGSSSSSASTSASASSPGSSGCASGSASDSGYSDKENEDGPAADASRGPGGSMKLPMCWGHRGASATYPENTLASFQQAILDGAEGIESDVHVTLDGTIVMFHDAHLNRVTNGKGLITKQNFKNGIDQLITTKAPAQPICTFAELLDLLMKPGNEHVLLNIDVKLDNEPNHLFRLIDEIVRTYADWEAALAPRLILGLWHPAYLEPAARLLPYCKLVHIGVSPALAKKYFWEACSGFSLNFSALVGREGEAFRAACRRAGKDLFVWTVNDRREMIQATRWGAKAILTDRTADYLSLRGQMSKDYERVCREVNWAHSWSNFYYFTPVNTLYMAWETFLLQRTAGPFVGPSSKAAVALALPATPSSDTSIAS